MLASCVVCESDKANALFVEDLSFKLASGAVTESASPRYIDERETVAAATGAKRGVCSATYVQVGITGYMPKTGSGLMNQGVS